MSLKIIWTNQFKKDYKRAIRRKKDINLLDDIIRTLSRGEPLPEKIKTTPCPAIGQDIENVISSRTGCWSIVLKITF